jgi:hypothetical protein
LNDYFPTCNLPRLYRLRRQEGDEERAQAAAIVTRLACERAEERGSTDEWLRPTRLGAAFGAGDISAATGLVTEIERSDELASWKLDTTLVDLERDIEHLADPDRRATFRALLRRLKALR